MRGLPPLDADGTADWLALAALDDRRRRGAGRADELGDRPGPIAEDAEKP
jgi:hypothetical protein